ncbi:MAG: ATP-binding protein [Candidatus Methylacidiphilales bacterium]|nr:ATP-binding protein [Candidatus Methylacidiphilales bacterium]
MTSRSITDPVRFQKVLRETVVLPVGLIVLAALVQTTIIVELFSVIGWYDHSGTIIARMHRCEKMFSEMETNWRRNLIATDPRYPEVLTLDRERIMANLRELKTQVKDNLDQDRMLDQVIHSINEWNTFVLTTFDNTGMPIARSLPVPIRERNFALQKEVQANFNRFVNREAQLRAERYEKVKHMEWTAMLGGICICLTLALGVGWHVRRQLINLSNVYEASLEIIATKNAELEISRNRLNDQKEWFRVILASIGDGVIVTDRRMTIQFLNTTAEDMILKDKREILQKDFNKIFHVVSSISGVPASEKIEQAMVNNEVLLLDNLSLKREAHSSLAVDATAAPIADTGGIVQGLVLVFRDATVLRAAEQAQRTYAADLERQVHERTHSLQRALGEMQAFSYTISHDLRSPLRAMQGYAAAILEDDPGLSEESQRFLNRIKNSAERLDKLIRDLLEYSRITFLDESTEVIDLNRLIDEIQEQYGNLRAPGIHITAEKPLLPVLGRELTLVQVLSNLLTNAAKFVRKGEEARIRVYTTADASPGRVRICVEDNGIGISKDELGKIFGMFVQAGSNSNNEYGGTGVGLAIVKKAAEGMGGTVGVESTLGRGSTFWVELAPAPPALPPEVDAG